MKKLATILMLAFPLFLATSCGGNKDGGDEVKTPSGSSDSVVAEVTDSVVTEDTTTATATEQNSEEAASSIDIDKAYKNALSLKKGKISEKEIPDQDDPDMTLPVTITNNSDITLNPSDYTINYSIERMEQVGDYLEGVTKKRTKTGPKLAPGESATVKIFEKYCLGINNPKVKLKISKEEFAKRYNN